MRRANLVLGLALFGFLSLSGRTGGAQSSGTGQPAFAASPSSATFGNIYVGSSSIQMIPRTNSGKANIGISQATASGSGLSLSGLSTPLILFPGQGSAVIVQSGSQTAGGVTGSVSPISNGPNSPTTIALNGTGIAATFQITASPTSLSFGDVTVGSSSTQTVTLANSGDSSVTISQISVSGMGFSASGLTPPATFAAGQNTSLSVVFAPTTTGTVIGSVSVVSDATDSPAAVALSGSGVQLVSQSVALSWDPSTSDVVGYNLYRGTQSGGPYARLNSPLILTPTYTDGTVQAGQTYFYVTTAVDSNNVESDFSNEVSITMPTPILSGGKKVTQASTTTTISSSNASSVVGEPVTFTISVADSSASTTRVPSGTAAISDGSTPISIVTLDGFGTASFTTALLSSADSPHRITAHYNGDTNFQDSDSNPASQAVSTRSTTTSLSFNPTPGTFGTAVTITATVTDTAMSAPTGTPDSFAAGLGGLATGRNGATATQLLNGLILVVGGQDQSGTVLGTAELYNPVTGVSTATSHKLDTARYGQAAALLADGRILIVGGTGASAVLPVAELYDPATDNFTTTGPLSTARMGATATLLLNGEVAVIGGSDGANALSSIEIFDPAASRGTGWFSGPDVGTGLSTARLGHIAALLATGKILIAGGNSGSGVLSSAELYDPSTNTSMSTGSLVTAREYAGAALMPNGYVSVAGGDSSSTPLGSAELYDTAAGVFVASGSSLGTARTQLTEVQLNDGHVLVIGGMAAPVPPDTNAAPLTSAELYTPTFAPEGAVDLGSTGTPADTFTGTCQLAPTLPVSGDAQSICTATIAPQSVGYRTVTGSYPVDAVHSSSSASSTFPVQMATTFSGLSNASITYGANSFIVSGTISAVSPVYQRNGETINMLAFKWAKLRKFFWAGRGLVISR